MHHLPYLVLPVITYTYSYLAFYSRQMRIGAVEVMHQDFIRTARAKGLPDRAILWKHVFRNALLPIVTLFADAFPLAVAGAVIIETIFAIPGMGQGMYNAVLTYDYPVIVGVFLIFGTMTLVGYLISDILYAVVDPRISYKNR
jgi:peptide/nickel transport system permease protein